MIEFRILGPFEVVEGDRPLALGGPKQRAVLAILLLHRGEVVATERLIDELWGERPPARAAKSLQVYVSNLRKVLGNGLLVTQGHGYLLRTSPGQLDLDRFEALVAEARQALRDGKTQVGSDRLRQALALWRGRALEDFAYESFAQSATAQLEEQRSAALEDRIDADLASGEHVGLVAELEWLVRRHPLRERLHQQLMLALYRSGRQAEALERYRSARQALIDELGIEPGPALRELEQSILTQDPSLAPPSRPVAPGRLGPRRRAPALLLIGAGLLLVAALSAALLSRGGDSPSVSLQANALGLVDPATGQLRAAVPVGGTPARVDTSGGQVWVSNDDAQTVALVDARAPAIAQVARIREFPSDFAVGEGAVWVVDRLRGRLVKISPDYGTVVGTSRVGTTATLSTTDDRFDVSPWAVAAGAGGIWITDGSSMLHRAEPRTGRIVRRHDLRIPLNDVAVGEGAVWAISGSSATVLRIDPRTGKVTARVAIVGRRGTDSPYPIAVAVGLGSVWVLNATAATVTRIDPRQAGVTTTIPIGIERVPRRIAVGAGAGWVANADGTLARIDAATNAVETTSIAPSLYDVAVGARGVWVTSGSAVAGGVLAASDAAGPRARALPSSQCSPVYSAPGARPRYLIVSDLPLGGRSTLHLSAAQLQQAILFALRERGFRAGRFTIGYQACDDYNVAYTSPANFWARCPLNARAYAANRSVLGVIGPFSSPCASRQIAIANGTPDGPLAMITPAATSVGLTHRAPGSGAGEPEIYYPTRVRNFVRLVPSDDLQGTADALLARQMGLRRVFVAHDSFRALPYGIGIAKSFAAAARRLGVKVVGTGAWPPPRGPRSGTADRPAIAAFVRRIARTNPDGVFLGGFEEDRSVPSLVRGLRRAMPRLQLIAPDGFAFFPQLVRDVGPAVDGMIVSQSQIAPSLLRGPGRRFAARFGKQIGGTFYPWTAYGAQAADVLLDAIARSDGTRSSVTRALFRTRVRNGLIGSFSFTPTGDTTKGSVTMIRVQQGKPVPLRVVTPPAAAPASG
jgi:DNA-binding SARP family transcriptional activator/ABC-type branched-subunit amino acid transport system substrate-binding protein/DNA-binding beta-propeller fold protein YncE